MNGKKKKIFFLIMTIVIINFNIFLFQAKEKEDVFKKVLSSTDSNIVEISITTTFKARENYDYYYDNLLRLLREYTTSIEKELIYDNSNYREFKFDKVYGYIEKIIYKGETLMTINLVEKTNENKLEDLKGVLDRLLLEYDSDAKYFQQIKAVLGEKNLQQINYSITDTLISMGIKGLNTVKLNNGYSSLCNTKTYTAKKINGQLIDFQFAVVRYSSGNYLIMGTPEITLAF
ncbi:YwmB family TATA-box binding protein [Clostridium faecium]|uniref:TATA-box binding n=1 Tax=Clostridium faecium TaxID=2762223 RepID=A0ABR8YTM1_9CLOT|nr:hypothetical protein [Clostridium faecium]MBD8047613.1 hypothetical protein [Clostridium faecium]